MLSYGQADPTGSAGHRRVRLAIVAFTLSLVALLIGAVAVDVWREYRDTVEQSGRTADNLARTLEEHAAGLFRRADLLLSSIAEAAQRAPGGADDPAVRQLMRSYAAFLHPQESLSIVDSAGVVRFDPREPRPSRDVRDRDYFVVHRDQPDTRLYVSSALTRGADSARAVGLSRRVSTPEGRFAGIVLYTVGTDSFRALYGSLRIGPTSNVTLWDGAASRVLARFPDDESLIGRSFERGPLFEMVRDGARVGRAESVSPLDGIQRLVSFRKLADAPFVVSVGLARIDYLRPWRDGLPTYLAAVAAIALAVLGLGATLHWQFARWAATEARLAAVTANVPGAIYQRRVDASGARSYPWVSAGIQHSHGFSAEAAMRDPSLLANAIHPDDRAGLEGRMAAAAATGTPLTWEGRIRRVDGAERWIQVVSRARRAQAGAVEWDGVILDITERKQMEAALHAAREAADAANRSKSQFLANMSHELRTPLNAILGFSEILQAEYFGPLNHKQREYIGDIHRSGMHLLQVISNILDISKIEAGKDELTEETVALEPLVRAQFTLLMPQARSGDVRLRCELAAGLPPVRADGVKVKQMMLNLLSNAIKFTPPGGLVTVVADLEPDSGDLLVSVLDTGIGMARDDIPAALEPFRRLDSGRSLRSLGTGLGLPITRAQIEMHGGALEIVSEPGVGTRATLRFPAARVLPPDALLEAPGAPAPDAAAPVRSVTAGADGTG